MLNPKHGCAQLGCRELTSGRFCARHQSEQPRRVSVRKQGYDDAWSRYSQAFLRAHPICADPDRRHPGQLRAATDVDHIKAARGDMRLFWDHGNHRALCASCHSSKTAARDGGFGNKIKR
jgi:5-methylcytosine-specific restriction protein A